jgi:hypothetical protein
MYEKIEGVRVVELHGIKLRLEACHSLYLHLYLMEKFPWVGFFRLKGNFLMCLIHNIKLVPNSFIG